MNAKVPGLLVAFFSIAVIAFSITQLVLVHDNLFPGHGWYETCYPSGCYYWYNDGLCLMNQLNTSINICKYSYAVSAIGIVAALFTVFALCLPPVASCLIMAFQSVWWLAASITFTTYYNKVHGQELETPIQGGQTVPLPWPNTKYYRMVYALALTCFAVCLFSVPLALSQKRGNGKGDRVAQAAEKPQQMPVGAAGMPPATAAV